MNANPFTLNVKKSVELSSSSELSSHSIISPSLLKDNVPTEKKYNDLQKEIVTLKKEIEAKDAKLSSSFKSIKQFWSPELKKERAYRKEETEKFLILQDKYQIANSQIEEYKNTLEDLESELNTQQSQNSLLNKHLHDEQDKTENCKGEIKLLESQNKEIVKELHELQKAQSVTVNDQLEEELKEKDKLIQKLQVQLREQSSVNDVNHQSEVDILCKSLGIKEDELTQLEKKYNCLEKDYKAVSEEKLAIEEDAKKEINLLNQELQSAQDTILYLEQTLDKQEDLYVSTANDLETLQKKDQETAESIHKLEITLQKKDKEYKSLQLEITTLEQNLLNEEKEKRSLQEQVNNHEHKLQEMRDGFEKSKTVASHSITKIEELEEKISQQEETLEKYKSQVHSSKLTISELNSQCNKLRSELSEKSSLVARLENEKKSREQVSTSSYEKLKADHAALEKSLEKKLQSGEKERTSLKEDCNRYKKESEDMKKKMEKSSNTSKTQEEKIKALEQTMHELELKCKKLLEEKKVLETKNEQTLRELNSSKEKGGEVESTTRTQSIEEKVTNKGSSYKNLWDELAKKESKIIELEKLLKDKSKQLVTLKKNQSVEREKLMMSSNEKKKSEIQINSQVEQLKSDVLVKDQRIAMLEDALRESVTIAVEREDILARHFEIIEGRSKDLSEVEAECDRIAVEKAVVNFKNAFLILTLSERDALVASMRANRKRYLEELFNIKQETLLSAVTEKDNQIGHLELQSLHNKQSEIKRLKKDKERLVTELKEQNNTRMKMLANDAEDNFMVEELETAPAEQVYEAIRFLARSSGKLEYYIEELCNYLREKSVNLLDGLPDAPKRKGRSFEALKQASKEELLKELKSIDADNRSLKKYVDRLLDKLRD